MRFSVRRLAGLLFFFTLSALYAEPTYVIKDIRYLNFDKADNAEYVRFDSSAGWDQVEHWARNRGTNAVKDREPYVDNKASFVSVYGSELKLSNLNQNANYSLFIDFVCYTGDPKVTSKLVISIRNTRLATLTFGQTPLDRPYELIIPRELCYDGTADIHFDEFATTPGSWGIWDMILSTSGLPLESIRPKKKEPELKETQPKVAEPDKKKTRKTVKPSAKDKKPGEKAGAKKPEAKPSDGKAEEAKPEQQSIPPVQPKKNEPTVIEPNVVREPEIKDIETKTPIEPKAPAGPSEVTSPADVRDLDPSKEEKKK